MNLKIGKNCKISEDIFVDVIDELVIHDCVYIGKNVSITGVSVEIGPYSFLEENIVIGGGQSKNPNSKVKIGKGCLLCKDVYINNADIVNIGDEVGIGQGVHIWTHGGFLSVLDGFPSVVSPVEIGCNVWIPEKTSIYAGTKIGNNVVIAPNSSVNHDIPSGSFAGGNPCKIIKENAYPKVLTNEDKALIYENLISKFQNLLAFKNIDVNEVTIEISEDILSLNYKDETTKFDFQKKTFEGSSNEISEDLRDFLRRHGIRFYNGNPFQSIGIPGNITSRMVFE